MMSQPAQASVVTELVKTLHGRYDELQRAISSIDWVECQRLLAECNSGFQQLFNISDALLREHFVELKVLRQRHNEILIAVRKVRDSLSLELGHLQRAKEAQKHYQSACHL